MDSRNKQGRQAGGGRAAGAPTARAPSVAPRRDPARTDAARAEPRIAGAMSAMRMDPDFHAPHDEPEAGGTETDDDAPTGGEMPGMPGSGGASGRAGMDGAAQPLPRFGGRLAGLGPLGAPAAGEMPAGDMNGGLAALLGDEASGSDALDQPPPDGESMPTGAMEETGNQSAAGAMHAMMNEGRLEMPTGAMSNGHGAAMPLAGSLRRREDPDAGGEVRRREDPDAGGELGAAPADAGAGGMPSADMHRAPSSDAAASPDAASGTATLAIGGQWRLTLSSLSLGRV